MRTVIAFCLAVMLFTVAGVAHAACHYEWVCDGNGHCGHVPLCDNAIDIVPPEPPSMKPIPPPSIRPLQPPALPPIGTKKCTQVQRQDADGSWYWDTVCY